MSQLVSWASIADLHQGLFPRKISDPSQFLTGADFDNGVLDEIQPNGMVGNYNGSASLADYGMSSYIFPLGAFDRYQTTLTKREFILLFKQLGYASVYRSLFKEAYPKGSALGDDNVLVFFEAALNGDSIDLKDDVVIDAFAEFVTSGYMTQQQSDDILKGVLI